MGAKFLNSGFGRARDAVRDGVDPGLRDAGEEAMTVADRYIPVLTGEMRATGFVEPAGRNQVAVGFDHPGAVVQHERMDYRHDDGGPKFLERAVAETRKEQAEALADQIRRRLR